MAKKNNSITAIVIILVSVVLFVGIGAYTANRYSKMSKDFVLNKSKAATKMYDDIISINFETNYPESPDKVVEIYNNISFMIYNGMIVNDEITKELLMIQRQLYSSELLALNDFDSQYNKLLEDIKTLLDGDAKTYQFQTEKSIIDKNNPNVATVYVKQSVRKVGDVEWNYHLVKENDRWKINSLESLGVTESQ